MNPDSSCGEKGVPGTLSCLQCDSFGTEKVLGKAGMKHLGVLYLTLLKLYYSEISLGGKIPSTSCITSWQCSLWIGWLKARQKWCFKVFSLFTPHSPPPASSGAPVVPVVECSGLSHPSAAPASPTAEQRVAPVPHLWLCPRARSALERGDQILPCARPWESQQNKPRPRGQPLLPEQEL